tara:strand:+ start:94202 stop:94612 length:411 start_codon:yes stop_codon:yes gene_type:complete
LGIYVSLKGAVTTQKTILLVDDDALVRRVVRRQLELIQFDVVEASNGAAAVAILRDREDILALVSDVDMPIMNGLELAQTVALQWPALPVVLVSGRRIEVEDRSSLPTNLMMLAKPLSADIISQVLVALAPDPAAA